MISIIQIIKICQIINHAFGIYIECILKKSIAVHYVFILSNN